MICSEEQSFAFFNKEKTIKKICHPKFFLDNWVSGCGSKVIPRAAFCSTEVLIFSYPL